jgi:hypothetical protein
LVACNRALLAEESSAPSDSADSEVGDQPNINLAISRTVNWRSAEIRPYASWRPLPIAFYHFRDRDNLEVDIALEQGAGTVAGVEVKATATVSAADFRGLRKLKEAAGKRFAGGVVLYDGEASGSFGDAMHAVPIRAQWEAL